MIGLDSNVLVRYLAQDDPRQSAQVDSFFATHLSAETPGFVNLMVLVEVVWVLKRAYGFDGSQVNTVIGALIDSDDIEIEHADDIRMALDHPQSNDLDLADILIAIRNRSSGCTATISFDQEALRAGIMTEVAAS